ncbi:hypothetical protein [Burkholderia ambifaria]|nr:hypothetical protein [Burkholderia ambifaria]
MSTTNSHRATHDDRATRAPVPPEHRAPSPAHFRDCVRRYRGTLPADVEQALLDAAQELEASEDAFAVVVDQKHALQRRLAQTESNLRAALAPHARRDLSPEQPRPSWTKRPPATDAPHPPRTRRYCLRPSAATRTNCFCEARFFVTLRHADTMPDARIDVFLVVRDGGCPFLLGFVREGLGIRLLFYCYIACGLKRELRDTRAVEVVEHAAGEETGVSGAVAAHFRIRSLANVTSSDGRRHRAVMGNGICVACAQNAVWHKRTYTVALAVALTLTSAVGDQSTWSTFAGARPLSYP